MMSSAHLAVGVATAMLCTQAKTKEELIIAAIGGSIGGIMSDIDVKVDTKNVYSKKASMDAPFGQITAIALSTVLLLVDYFLLAGKVCAGFTKSIYFLIPALCALCVLIILGHKSNHRDKTHSVLALILFSACFFFIHREIGIAFAIGFLSHLLIDLLNKSPERLFYPARKGVCFKLVYADRLGNHIIFTIGVCYIVFHLAVYA